MPVAGDDILIHASSDPVGQRTKDLEMNVPLIVCFVYLMLGMITTTSVWVTMPEEIEMAIGLEEEEIQPALRVFLTIVFVLAWPAIVVELVKKR